MQEMKFQKPIPSAVAIALTFIMPRPKSHYGTDKNSATLKESARQQQHISKPDLDKLIRCVKDALTSIVWNDDSQVTEVTASKIYESASRGTGVHIQISERS
jgi:Holliday junction resolvase RusA-like endonuclease